MVENDKIETVLQNCNPSYTTNSAVHYLFFGNSPNYLEKDINLISYRLAYPLL